jgi:hypothetical protein
LGPTPELDFTFESPDAGLEDPEITDDAAIDGWRWVI